ncbi:hypothetical protein [Nocardioides houyundeii]|uniref:hypothetical protein n=1 Tax=Nocardioides houyundeii TaxID=2045452 RepID=UPI0013B375CA|nr:hypothetical protein [Nocardioides houyundeii]
MGDLRAQSPESGMPAEAARRGRPPSPLVDRTPLNGAAIDVGTRVGWMLRVSRLTAGEETRDDIGLRELVVALRKLGIAASESTLSRLEAGRVRSGALVDGYEQVLGLAPTSLRAPIEVLCRGTGQDPGRKPAPTTLAAVTAAVEPVLAGPVSGEQWLAFADVLSHPDVVALPEGLARTAIRPLASEVRRSVGIGMAARYEALSLLRCSRYGDIVLDIGLELLDQVPAPPLLDLARALGEQPSERLLTELSRRLDGTPSLLEGVVTALAQASTVNGLPSSAWEVLTEPVGRSYLESEPGSWRRANLAYLVRVLPAEQRHRVLARIGEPLPAPIRQPAEWTSSRRNIHHTAALDVARRITEEQGIPEQPVLARLLFEALYDPRMSREFPAVLMLSGLPFADSVVRHVAALHDDISDETTRTVAPWLLMRMRSPDAAPHVGDWVGPEPQGLVAALVLAHSGRPVPLDAVTPFLSPLPQYGVRALAALALAGNPVLGEIASGQHPSTDAETSATARWLLDDGPRVTP